MKHPTSAEIRAAREAAGLTQTQAAAVLDRGLSWWQRLEDGSRRMTPMLWHCWQHWSRGKAAPPL